MLNLTMSNPRTRCGHDSSANYSAPSLRDRISLPIVDFVLVQDGLVLDLADHVESLYYSKVNVRNVWSVYANYGECQCCIACSEPCPILFGDATFAVGTGLPGSPCYVNGSAFVPCVIRAQLATLAAHGEFSQLRSYLPHVASKPILTTNGPFSPYLSRPDR